MASGNEIKLLDKVAESENTKIDFLEMTAEQNMSSSKQSPIKKNRVTHSQGDVDKKVMKSDKS